MSPREAIANLPSVPNRVLENFFMKKKYNAFGRDVSILPEYLASFRKEIIRRNTEGVYKYANRAERRNLFYVRLAS